MEETFIETSTLVGESSTRSLQSNNNLLGRKSWPKKEDDRRPSDSLLVYPPLPGD
jgi:hypothetical protein